LELPHHRASPSSSLRVLRQHDARRSCVAFNTVHNISLSLPLSGRAYVARSHLCGWVVACGLVGSSAWSGGWWRWWWWGRGGGGVVEGLCPPHLIHAPIARPAARETIASPVTHEHHAALSATVRGKLVQQRQRGRHGARCIHTDRPLSSRAHLVRSYTRAANIRLAHSSSRRSNERGLMSATTISRR